MKDERSDVLLAPPVGRLSEFVCGTRRVKEQKTTDYRTNRYRVVCATCEGGGTVSYDSKEKAQSAAVRDSNRPCPVGCGAR